MFMVEDDNIAFKISIIDAFASYKILHYPFKVIIFFPSLTQSLVNYL